MIILIVITIIILFIIWLFVFGRNKLVRYNLDVDESYSQIDVQLQRRYDLIPNLVETVKGYSKHEKELLESVTLARSGIEKAINSKDIKDLKSAEKSYKNLKTQLSFVAEQYPDLKSNQNFMRLQEELTSTENKIAFARQAYNTSVKEFNVARNVFPTVLLASMFQKREMFEIENESVKENVHVKF